MKFASYAEYDPKGIALSIPALLTVWAAIQRFSEDLVLVGGLVPHFICRHPESDTRLPRPATVDVDIGIALGASSGQYGSLLVDLQAQGFRASKKFETRFERVVGPTPCTWISSLNGHRERRASSWGTMSPPTLVNDGGSFS